MFCCRLQLILNHAFRIVHYFKPSLKLLSLNKPFYRWRFFQFLLRYFKIIWCNVCTMNQRPSWLFYKTDQGLPQLLTKALNQEQFKEVPENHRNDKWNLYWKACGFTLSDYRNVKTWQILNHFPKVSLNIVYVFYFSIRNFSIFLFETFQNLQNSNCH